MKKIILVVTVLHALIWLMPCNAQSEWSPINTIPDDSVLESAFEVLESIDDFERPGRKWNPISREINAKTSLSPDSSMRNRSGTGMRVQYQFSGHADNELIQFTTPVEIDRPGLWFGFWVKTDGTAFPIRLRFSDATGELHQWDVPVVYKPYWQYVAVDLDSVATGSGGDGNQKLDFPCRLNSICFVRPFGGFIGAGQLWIDDVSIVRKRESEQPSLRVDVNDSTFGNVYQTGDSLIARAKGDGDSIRWQLIDFWGARIAFATGKATETPINVELQRPGYYSCWLELIKNKKVIERRFLTLAVFPKAKEILPSNFIGMNTHFGFIGERAYNLECMDLLQRYGIDQYRDGMGSWGQYEASPGVYVLPEHAQQYLARSRNLKMRPLTCITGWNRLYDEGGFPNSPEAIRAFASFASALVSQNTDAVQNFEIWNEWVGGTGMEGRPGIHDGEAYGRLLRETYAAIKKDNPQATVVGVGGENPARVYEGQVTAIETLDGIFKTAGSDSMDAWSIHPYQIPRPPEIGNLPKDVRDIHSHAKKNGVDAKLWVTEIGWLTKIGSPGISEEAQACYLVRSLTLLQAMRVVDKAYWYDFQDDGLSRTDPRDNYGIVHNQFYNCSPKPAAVALGVLIQQTQNAACGPIWNKGPAYAGRYEFSDQEQCLVVWSIRPTKVRIGGRIDACFDMMGSPITVQQNFTLGNFPIYVRGRDLAVEVTGNQ
jgi:hypothetical protein